MTGRLKAFQPCIVIPIYNHGATIGPMVTDLEKYGLPCIIVNDGSDFETKRILDKLAVRYSLWVSIVDLPKNRGKGAAVAAGLCAAWDRGFTHGLQIYPGRQHCIDDIPRFLAAGENHPNTLVLGKPLFDPSIPLKR